MERIQTCESCPAMSGMVERFQEWIDRFYVDYTKAGEALLDRLLAAGPDESDSETSTEQLKKQEQQARRFNKATRNMSLSIMYLSQLESGIDYVNNMRCAEVGKARDCPRLIGLMTLAEDIQQSMLQDVKETDKED